MASSNNARSSRLQSHGLSLCFTASLPQFIKMTFKLQIYILISHRFHSFGRLFYYGQHAKTSAEHRLPKNLELRLLINLLLIDGLGLCLSFVSQIKFPLNYFFDFFLVKDQFRDSIQRSNSSITFLSPARLSCPPISSNVRLSLF